MINNKLKHTKLSELKIELFEYLRELFNLRMQSKSNQLHKPHLIKKARKNIARIKTLITQKKSNI